MPTTIVCVHDLGNDVLRVEGTVGDSPELVQAFGWMSALSNHYDAADYDAQTGHLKPSAKARPMSKDETHAYCLRLLEEQHLQPEPAPLPTLLDI